MLPVCPHEWSGAWPLGALGPIRPSRGLASGPRALSRSQRLLHVARGCLERGHLRPGPQGWPLLSGTLRRPLFEVANLKQTFGAWHIRKGPSRAVEFRVHPDVTANLFRR